MPVPGHRGRDSDAAFVEATFATTIVAVVCYLAGRRATVVARENEECVVAHARLFDGADDRANRIVCRGEHGSVFLTFTLQIRICIDSTFWRLIGRVDSVEWYVKKEGLLTSIV